MVGSIFLGVGEERGLEKEKQGSAGIKAALHISLYETPKKEIVAP